MSIVPALEGRPSRVDDEARKDGQHDRRLDPPPVAPHGLAQAAPDHRELRIRHSVVPLSLRRTGVWATWSGPAGTKASRHIRMGSGDLSTKPAGHLGTPRRLTVVR